MADMSLTDDALEQVGKLFRENGELRKRVEKVEAEAETMSDQLMAIDDALREAGVEFPIGVRGVRDLATQRNGQRERAELAEAALAEAQQRHRDAYLVVMEERDNARNQLRAETALARELLERNVELGTRTDTAEAERDEARARLAEIGETRVEWGVRGGGGTFRMDGEAEARWHVQGPAVPMIVVRRLAGEWREVGEDGE